MVKSGISVSLILTSNQTLIREISVCTLSGICKLKLLISKEIAANSEKETKYRIFLRVYNLAGAAVCEELFFRGFILTIDAPIIILIFTSTILFMINHYILPWGSRFSKSDLITQLLIGFASTILFIYSGSILPCIFLHLLMNTPEIIKNLRCFQRHYIRKEYYDKLIKEKNTYAELEI